MAVTPDRSVIEPMTISVSVTPRTAAVAAAPSSEVGQIITINKHCIMSRDASRPAFALRTRMMFSRSVSWLYDGNIDKLSPLLGRFQPVLPKAATVQDGVTGCHLSFGLVRRLPDIRPTCIGLAEK